MKKIARREGMGDGRGEMEVVTVDHMRRVPEGVERDYPPQVRRVLEAQPLNPLTRMKVEVLEIRGEREGAKGED